MAKVGEIWNVPNTWTRMQIKWIHKSHVLPFLKSETVRFLLSKISMFDWRIPWYRKPKLKGGLVTNCIRDQWGVCGEVWFAQSDRGETRRNSMESKSGSIQPAFPMKKDMIATKPFRHRTTNIYDWHISHPLFHLRTTNMECKKTQFLCFAKTPAVGNIDFSLFFYGPSSQVPFPGNSCWVPRNRQQMIAAIAIWLHSKGLAKTKNRANLGEIFFMILQICAQKPML